MRWINSILFFLAVSMLCFIVKVKYEVNQLLVDIKSINKKLEYEKREVNSLRAEWAYLNNPVRIASLTAKYLKLEKIYLDRVAEVRPNEGLKFFSKEKNLSDLAAEDAPLQKSKWNYKKDHHYEFRNGNLVGGKTYQVKY